MKKIILALLVASCSPAFAGKIECYSGNQVIYSGQGTHIIYADGYIAFTDASTKSTTYVLGDCVVKTDRADK